MFKKILSSLEILFLDNYRGIEVFKFGYDEADEFGEPKSN